MEFHVIKRLGQRLLADAALQHFYAVLIAHDARFLGAGAQGFDQLGGPPMGMHIDHGSLLQFILQRFNRESPSIRDVVWPTIGQSIPTAIAKQALARSRVHPQIAWAKLRDGAAIASKKLWSEFKSACAG
jgi:hypothetical protein